MKTSLALFERYVISAFALVAMLASCSGSQPPTGAPAAIPPGSRDAPFAVYGKPWMDPSAKGRNLLYVSQSSINVYSYPRGTLLGSLGVGGGGLCSDKAGDVFIPQGEFDGQVLVFAHGATTPKATLNSPYGAEDCSVDPADETVATTEGFGGIIVIFPYNPRRGWRLAKVYKNPVMEESSFCAYDNNGNLFVDGVDYSDNFMLAELPKGSKTFTSISLNQRFVGPGSVQWDGRHLAIADLGPGSKLTESIIYRFTISGSSGTKVSTTTLHLSSAHAQFWIQGSKVIGPIAYDSVRSIGFWRFPAGGQPIKTFSDTAPSGETVSLK